MASGSHTTVLISGAGPTGLMLACQLARHGVDFRIVDGKSGPTRESRALAVQARTLELYQGLGISDAAIKQGWQTPAVNLFVGSRRAQRVPFTVAGAGLSPFPFLLILEQSRNETLLYEKLKSLGRDVEWRRSLKQMQPAGKNVSVTLEHEDGREEQLIADWLVGCDGARSPVREQLKMPFGGGTYENIFYVADTRVDWELPYGELSICISPETFVLFFPMAGEHRYRVIGILPSHQQDESRLKFEDIEAAVRGQMDVPVHFSDTSWFSVYRVHHRCVDHFRDGRVLLAGDAAHVHSPVGGQGMNTGLQDACNLAWKLALVSQDLAGESLLDSYHAERWPFAQRLLKTTDTAFRFVISQNPFIRWFRLHVFPRFAHYFMGFGPTRRFVFRTVSQININYRGDALAGPASTLRVRAGERFPYVDVAPPLTNTTMPVYAWLSEPGFHLLLIHRKETGIESLAAEWRKRLDTLCPGWFHVHAVTDSAGSYPLFDRLGVRERALVLVRPDQYLGYVATDFDWEKLERYLRDQLGLTHPV